MKSISTSSGRPRISVVQASAAQREARGLDSLAMAPMSPNTQATASDAAATLSVTLRPPRMADR